MPKRSLRRILAVIVAVVAVGVFLGPPPPAGAVQLPPNTSVNRTVGSCTTSSQYGVFYVPVAQTAVQPFPACYAQNILITLVFANGSGGLWNVDCQGGYTGPGLNGLGTCHWDGYVEQAIYPSSNYIAFGMKVTMTNSMVAYSAYG